MLPTIKCMVWASPKSYGTSITVCDGGDFLKRIPTQKTCLSAHGQPTIGLAYTDRELSRRSGSSDQKFI